MGCGDAVAKNATPLLKPPYNPFEDAIKAARKANANVQESMMKQPSAYSGATAGPYISAGSQGAGVTQQTTPVYPTVKVFRPVAPPLPPATVTLTLTERQAQHLRTLLGCIGTNHGEPIISGWSWGGTTRPVIVDLRRTTDAIHTALVNQGV